MTGDDGDFALVDAFAEVARQLLAEDGHPQGTLDRVCRLAVSTVDACNHAGVSIVDRREVHQVASSDAIPGQVDTVVEETGEGPCHDAIKNDAPVVTGDLAEDHRWLAFGPEAHERSGVHSIASFPLHGPGKTIAVLNLYSKRPDAFTDDEVHVGAIFSAHAAVALVAMQKRQQFDAALASRDAIGIAKGILMARSNISDDQAFDLLRKASQRMNKKIREIAEGIVSGESPTAGA